MPKPTSKDSFIPEILAYKGANKGSKCGKV